MKMITAIIKPSRLDAVLEAVTEAGASGLTVTEVRGYGRQKGKTEVYRGAEYEVKLLPKVKLEIAVSGDIVDAVVEPLRVLEPLSPVSTETPAESLPLTMIDPLLWVIEPFMVPGPTTRMPNSLDWFAQGPSLMPSPLLSE